MDVVAAWDAVILTGGGARRLDGVAKHLLDVGGRTVLARVVGAAAGASRVVVVGPPDRTPGVDVFVREQPPGGGPVAALAAGLDEIQADWVVLLAGDLPFLTVDALSQLRTAAAGAPVVVAVDDDGRDQYLLALWSVGALRAAFPSKGSRAGRALRSLYRDVSVARVELGGFPPPWWDCDTPVDLEQARRWVDLSAEMSGLGPPVPAERAE
jgi:molybdenum cofactor guanylyltransferase